MKTFGLGLYWIGVIASLLVDLFSLLLLANQEGLGWAIAAFIFVPAQLFVPFYVGTWHLAIGAFLVLFIGAALAKDRVSD